MKLDNGMLMDSFIMVRKLDKTKADGVAVRSILNTGKICEISAVPGKSNQVKVVYESGQNSVTVTLMENINDFVDLMFVPAKAEEMNIVNLGSPDKPATQKDITEKKEEIAEPAEKKPAEEKPEEVIEEKKPEVKVEEEKPEPKKEEVIDTPPPAEVEAKPEEENKPEGKKEN